MLAVVVVQNKETMKKDKYNPYGIEKDYECKTCFGQFYDKEIINHEMDKATLSHRCKQSGETVDGFSMNFHPICPKCGSRNMNVIVHSYKEGSWGEMLEGGKFEFGFSIRSLGFYYWSYFNIN
jgi:Zn finger protein HypA/HybF involved in hydrogenase expression